MMKVGQEVICISQEPWIDMYDGNPMNGPTYHQKLIIEGIVDLNDLVLLEFNEFPNSGFDKNFFKPIAKTDISIFEKMLKPREELVN